MTVYSLKTALDLRSEMIDEGAACPLVYVYERTSGQVLFAVFESPKDFDLDAAPDVETYKLLDFY